MVFSTLLCCIAPWLYCIREVKKGTFTPNAKERAVFSKSGSCDNRNKNNTLNDIGVTIGFKLLSFLWLMV